MAKEQKPETGTERVIADGKSFIPGPHLPEKEPVAPVAKKKPGTTTDRSSQNRLVPALQINHDQNRLARLKELGRTVREVAWLLAEYNKISKPKKA